MALDMTRSALAEEDSPEIRKREQRLKLRVAGKQKTLLA
jgi:hypothetical protein